MLPYILRRVLYSIPVLLLASFITYVGIRATFDPLPKFGRTPAAQRLLAIRREELGLNRPLIAQWWTWLKNFVTGDWGYSEQSNASVKSMIGSAMWPTLQLAFWITLVSVLLAVGIGVYSAVRQYSVGDYTFTGLSYIGIAMPPFWLALLALAWLGTWPKTQFNLDQPIFPFIGLHSTGESGFNLDYLRHLFLPVMTVVVGTVAAWSRFQRSSMLETLNADYVRTARAKGVSRRKVIWKHAFRNALIPMLTVIALDTAFLFGGLIVTENIFSIPGMGALFLKSLSRGDAPVLLAWFVVTAILIIIFNLIADLLYGVLDPRIRVS